jgi:hypothetical protein
MDALANFKTNNIFFITALLSVQPRFDDTTAFLFGCHLCASDPPLSNAFPITLADSSPTFPV